MYEIQNDRQAKRGEMKYRKYKEERKKKGERKVETLKDSFFSPLYSFTSPLYFLFLYTSFIFDRGHVTDLLRYVFL